MRSTAMRAVLCIASICALGAPALAASPATTTAAGPAKDDANMQAVLDALTKLGGKPIETLTQARLQLSGAEDDVRAVAPLLAIFRAWLR